jgi:hypothetical protein
MSVTTLLSPGNRLAFLYEEILPFVMIAPQRSVIAAFSNIGEMRYAHHQAMRVAAHGHGYANNPTAMYCPDWQFTVGLALF